jgi:hypothetical protein
LESITIDNKTSDGKFAISDANAPHEIRLLFTRGEGSIKGRITAPFPIPGLVSISIIGSTGVIGPLTPNPDGTFHSENVKLGDYLVNVTATINKQTFATGKGKVTVRRNTATPVDIILQKIE